MKYWIDYSQILPFFYPIFLIIGLFVYFFLRGIVMVFVSLLTKTSEVESSKPSSPGLFTFLKRNKSPKARPKNLDSDEDSGAESGEGSRPLLTEEKIQIYQMARVLFKQNKIVEAAQMLETIELGDKAVRVLVKHGRIDEAAATLVRLNASDRAAALFDEHKKFAAAAELYAQLENWERAAFCYEQLAKEDFQHYQAASDCHLRAGNLDAALSARAKLGLIDEIFQISVTHKAWTPLGRFMEFPSYSYRILPLFDATMLDEFLMALELVPHTALLLAQWISYRSDEAMVLAILRKLGVNPALAIIFWQHLDPYGLETMYQRSLAVRQQLPSSLTKVHAEALLALGRAEWAHDILSPSARPPLPVPPVVMKI